VTTCWDGIKAAVEPCDDGNMNDSDGCTNACTIQDPLTTNCIVIGVKSYCDVCGNNMRNTPEVCDDGNRTDG